VKIIVPLAGPDYFSGGTAKGLIETPHGPLLLSTLRMRCWFDAVPSANYSFVLLDSSVSREFYHDFLLAWFPGCTASFISKPTRGAALTSLIGCAAIMDSVDEEIIIDLADIQFSTSHIPFSESRDSGYAAIGYSFESSLPCYSYFEVADDACTVIRAEEKKIISTYASAGVYCFRNLNILLSSLAVVLEQGNLYTYNGIYYVCPLFNGVIASGNQAMISPVFQVCDIKTS